MCVVNINLYKYLPLRFRRLLQDGASNQYLSQRLVLMVCSALDVDERVKVRNRYMHFCRYHSQKTLDKSDYLLALNIAKHALITYYLARFDLRQKQTLVSTDQSVYPYFYLFLRYVSTLLWRLGVAPVSYTYGCVFLNKHIAFILTGQ